MWQLDKYNPRTSSVCLLLLFALRFSRTESVFTSSDTILQQNVTSIRWNHLVVPLMWLRFIKKRAQRVYSAACPIHNIYVHDFVMNVVIRRSVPSLTALFRPPEQEVVSAVEAGDPSESIFSLLQLHMLNDLSNIKTSKRLKLVLLNRFMPRNYTWKEVSNFFLTKNLQNQSEPYFCCANFDPLWEQEISQLSGNKKSSVGFSHVTNDC